MRGWVRALGVSVVLMAALPGCGGAKPTVESPAAQARKRGPTSNDGEQIARWLLAEQLAPGGSAAEATKARQRLDDKKAEGMLASLARGIDEFSHGHLAASGRAFLKSLQAARDSNDPLAPMVGWYAANHLLLLDTSVPGLWPEARAWVVASIDAPGRLGWRARGELVEWSTRHAFEEAERDLAERTTVRFGCAREVRIAGPFGHGVPADRWRSFEAEKPGPWPAVWKPDTMRSTPARVRKVERQGCAVRIDEAAAGGVFYAETFVEVSAPTDMIVAVQGALQVWVDDQEVMKRDLRTWGVWPRFGVRVTLGPGRHRLLAKLAEPETSIRLLDPSGVAARNVTTSGDAAAAYETGKVTIGPDPNLLMRYLGDGQAHPPADEIEVYLAAYLAAIEGQHDVASVLLEGLVREQDRATALSLATAATYAEKDPIFPENDARDLSRALRERAVALDPKLYFSRLWLLLDRADKSPADAARAVQAMVDEFPEVPELRRVLVGLYGRLGWRAERTQAAASLAAKFPDDAGALETAIPALEEAGRLKEADALAAHLRQSQPDSEIELDRAVARHDYAAAVAELKRLGQRRPERKDTADRVAALLLRAGDKVDTLALLERALRLNPRDQGARLQLADARFARGDRGALRSALATAIERGYDADGLRGAVELVEGVTELEPYRLRTADVIAAYERDNAQLDGTAARILDYSALWVHGDGSARMLEHEIIRVQSQEAIGKLAEQRVPPGALVLRLRVLKKDGTSLEPERVEGKPTVTMPHLEVGDHIETEYVLPTDSDGEGGARYISPHWFFREADIAYWRSEFLVLSPRQRPLQIETTGTVPPPEVDESGPVVKHRWRVDRSPAAAIEPGSPPIQEFLPSVRVGWGVTGDGQLARMLDAAFDDTSRDPRIVRVARSILAEGPATSDPIEKARRLYRWVVANIEDGREGDGRKVIIGKSGSRAAAFLYLARAVDVPLELGVVRDRLRPEQEGVIASSFAFEHLALRIARPCAPPAPCPAPLWMTVSDRHVPFGFLPAPLRGQPARRLVAGLPMDTTPAEGSLDGITYEGKVELRTDGSADIDLDQRFVGQLGVGMRSNLEQIPEEQLRPAVESKLLARALPGARLVKLDIVDRTDLDKPLTFRMKIEVSDFARKRGGGLVIRPPLLLKVSPLAALESRTTPLLLPDATHSEVHLSVHLPAGASIAMPPAPTTLRDGDRTLVVRDGLAGDTLTLDRTLDIPAGRVPVATYPAFRAFCQSVDETASHEVVIQLR